MLTILDTYIHTYIWKHTSPLFRFFGVSHPTRSQVGHGFFQGKLRDSVRDVVLGSNLSTSSGAYENRW